jgi:uncharacterized phage-associated protein
MLITHEREKMINAIIYFAKNTSFCGKTKLFKLLYFLDFEHYKDTGRSVTGLQYNAWKMGPVPVELENEIQCPDRDVAESIDFILTPTKKGNPMLLLKPKKEFDPSHFTKRELKLLEMLANEYKNKKAEEMIEATHLENLPWHRVFHEENRKYESIPYEYAFRKTETELMNYIVSENEEIIKNYR